MPSGLTCFSLQPPEATNQSHERGITDNGQEDRCGAARSSSSAACLRRFAAGRASAVAQTEAQAAVCVCVGRAGMVRSAVQVCIRTRPTEKFAHQELVISPEERTVDVNIKKKPEMGVVNNARENFHYKYDKVPHV